MEPVAVTVLTRSVRADEVVPCVFVTVYVFEPALQKPVTVWVVQPRTLTPPDDLTSPEVIVTVPDESAVPAVAPVDERIVDDMLVIVKTLFQYVTVAPDTVIVWPTAKPAVEDIVKVAVVLPDANPASVTELTDRAVDADLITSPIWKPPAVSTRDDEAAVPPLTGV